MATDSEEEMPDSPLTCDRCRNTPAVTLLAYWLTARESGRILRLLCIACTALDVKDLTDARWQHTRIPLATDEPGAVTEWAVSYMTYPAAIPDGSPHFIPCANEADAREIAADVRRSYAPAATIKCRTISPWKDVPDD